MTLIPSKPKGRLLFALVIFIVCIAWVEIIFRMVVFPDWRVVSQATFIRHPVYGTFQKPNMEVRRFNPPNYDVVNRTNSLGFRDQDEGFSDDLSGIWAAGASNSYGGFVEDTEIFSSRLQAMGYKIANLSSEGHRLSQQVKVVKHLASQGFRPRAVLFEMTLNNVLGDYSQSIADMEKPLQVTNDSTVKTTGVTALAQLKRQLKRLRGKAEIGWIDVKARLINNSAVYCWLKVGINGIPMLRDWTLKVGLRANVAFSDPAPPGLLQNQPGPTNDPMVLSTVDFAVAAEKWVKGNLNVPFGIILIPSHHQLNDKRFSQYVRHLGYKDGELDAARPYRLVLKGLISHGIPVLDTAPALMARDELLSFPDDGHMNAQAHEIVAKEIAAWLPLQFGLEPDQ